MKKICIVTGTRAEYGLLYWLMKEVEGDSDLSLQLVVTGMHLSPRFGSTYRQIEEDGFRIDEKVPMTLEEDSARAVTQATGQALAGFATAFDRLKPDCVVVLGDRFEILAAAIASLLANIHLVHIHGGEVTEGAFDDSIRHAITKMATFHFVAADDFRQCVIQMGERPEHVFTVGAPGLDHLERLPLLSKGELEREIDFSFGRPTFLVTFHPVTREQRSSLRHLEELLTALEAFPEARLIFTGSNADPDNKVIPERIQSFVDRNRGRASFFVSLGQRRYLSALQHVDLVIGNSSSGIIEVPSFRKPTVNLGDRQKGRPLASSVIQSDFESGQIVGAIRKALSDSFQATLSSTVNPYGKGGAAVRMKQLLKRFEPNERGLKKEFFKIPIGNFLETLGCERTLSA